MSRPEAGGPSYPPGVVLHVPHHSTVIPPEVREHFLLNDDELRRELVRMTDHRTLDLFAGGDRTVPVVAARVSRLVLDGHSFPAAPLPYEPDPEGERAEICIGTDPFHTPDRVRATFISAFQRAGFTVSCNRPFAGALVPLEHYQREGRVWAVMVEVNRGLYLECDSAAPRGDFHHFAGRVRAACCEAAWSVAPGRVGLI